VQTKKQTIENQKARVGVDAHVHLPLPLVVRAITVMRIVPFSPCCHWLSLRTVPVVAGETWLEHVETVFAPIGLQIAGSWAFII
jgi:hypothetical protein